MKKLFGILILLISVFAFGQMPDYTYTNIIVNGTTLVKTGPGFLHCITINSIGTSWNLAIVDNTIAAGTKVATITAIATQGQVCYDINFSVGLTIVTTGTLPGDITISWR